MAGKNPNEWTIEEIERLKAEYPEADLLALSDELNRSVRAIICQASKLKIKRLYNNSVQKGQKFCSLCKKYHPVSEFYRNVAKHDGYEYYCKRYYQIKNKRKSEKSKYDWIFISNDLKALEGDNRVKKKRGKATVTYVDGKAGKVCTECGKWKVLEDFSKLAKGVGGRGTKCKECFKQLYIDVKKNKE